MPVTYRDAVAHLDGACSVEEAEPLLEWLRVTPDAAIDLGGCAAAHAALVQVILAAAPHLTALPPDPVLAAALRAALPSHALDPQVIR